MNTTLTLADIRAAHARIADKIHRTPVLTSATLDALCGAQLFFKCENFQKIGAFKARGATNAVFALTDAEAANGVATHSSGNHAAALARAARLRGIPAHIVMPSNAPKTKIESVRRNGGIIVFCEPTLVAREAACAKIIAETGARLVHPFDDYAVMAGQGTATLELLEQARGFGEELGVDIVPDAPVHERQGLPVRPVGRRGRGVGGEGTADERETECTGDRGRAEEGTARGHGESGKKRGRKEERERGGKVGWRERAHASKWKRERRERERKKEREKQGEGERTRKGEGGRGRET